MAGQARPVVLVSRDSSSQRATVKEAPLVEIKHEETKLSVYDLPALPFLLFVLWEDLVDAHSHSDDDVAIPVAPSPVNNSLALHPL